MRRYRQIQGNCAKFQKKVGPHLALALVAVTMLVSTASCTLINVNTYKNQAIEIGTTANVNQDTAVAVDIVFVFDEKLAEMLSAITSRTWFREKQAYLVRYFESLVVAGFEMVPIDSVTIKPANLKSRFGPQDRAIAVLLFANYLVEDQKYTVDITLFKNPIISLEYSTISVREK